MAIALYFCSQEYIQNPKIHLSNVVQFSRENQLCDPDSNKQNTVHALAQCTTVKHKIYCSLEEKLNLLLLINDSDFMLGAGICGGLFFFLFNK